MARKHVLTKSSHRPSIPRRGSGLQAFEVIGTPKGTTRASSFKIDDLDRGIIKLLQEEGRLNYATIARKLNVSQGAVRNRLGRMIEAKVLRVLAVADPVALGYTGYAMILIKLAAGANPRELGEFFRDFDEVTYVLFTAGQYDLLVEVICESQERLHDFLLEHCYARPDIASVEPMVNLKMYKNLLKWGLPWGA